MSERILALDIESTGSDFIEGKSAPFVLYGINNNGQKFKWEFNLDPTTRLIHRDSTWEANRRDIKQVCIDHDLLVMHNGKFDLKGLQSINITLDWRGKYADTLIMSHVLDNLCSHKLKDLGEMYLDIPKTSEQDLKEAVRCCRRVVKKHLPDWKTAGSDSKGETKDDTAIALDYWLPQYVLLELGENHESVTKYNPSGGEHPWRNICDRYGFNDVELTLSLYLLFKQGLEHENLVGVYQREVELLEDSLYDMEMGGIPIREDAVNSQLKTFREIQQDHHETLMMISDVNYNSNKDLPAYLFGIPQRNDDGEVVVETSSGLKSSSELDQWEDYTCIFSSRENSLGLNPVKITKTNFSTDAYSINQLLQQDLTRKQRMYLTALREVGQVTKAIQQLETLQKKIFNGRVYCSFNQTGTKTTRFSCYNPNNQQISKGKEEENESGEKEVKYKIRSVFGPEKGRVWYAIDYSQLQLRIFASPVVAEEHEMYEALCAETMDAHTFVGCKIYDTDPDNLTKIQRRVAKNTNFGFVFGASPRKIELTAGVPGLWDTVMSLFPNAHNYMTQMKQQIKNQGFVETPCGYRLFVTHPHKAVNYIVQGTEGRICKSAMINVSRFLNSDQVLELTDNMIHPSEVRLCFQVHDELVFDFPSEKFEGQHIPLLQGIVNGMERAGDEIGIKTPVDIEVIHHEGDWSDPQHYSKEILDEGLGLLC
jgi:DNA polymerase I-like protein with 3'-5' exonuclease and polymerase domains